MVSYPPLPSAALDRLFHALADTTRRDIVTRLWAGREASVSTLAARYEMSFAAVQKHVAVLERAGLVSKRAQGRERLVRGNPQQLARARALLQQLERLWTDRFSQLDAVLAEPSPPATRRPRAPEVPRTPQDRRLYSSPKSPHSRRPPRPPQPPRPSPKE